MTLYNKTINIKLITHKSDLDGIGCGILMKAFSKLLNNSQSDIFFKVDISYCDYENTLETLTNFIESKEYKNYNALYLTDIAVEDDKIISYFNDMEKYSYFNYDLKLIDHHINSHTKASTKKYSIIDISGNRSAAKILFDYLHDNKVVFPPIVESFIDYVSSYDTWKWFSNNEVWPEIVNVNCFNKVKSDEDIPNYVEYMVDLLLEKNILIEEQDKSDIYNSIQERNLLISRKINDVHKTFIQGYSAGVVFVTDKEFKQRSIMGSKICQHHNDIEFVAIINVDSDKMSFRSTKDTVDLNDLASNYEGGGHKKAAGAKIVNYDIIFNQDSFKQLKEAVYIGEPLISNTLINTENIIKLIFN